MDYVNAPVYSEITKKINEYQLNHVTKPCRIKMSQVSNKRLAKDLNYMQGRESTISISVIFGLTIEIDNNLDEWEILILGYKKDESRKK